MKNAKMKRTLAFWLAVAMLSSSVPMALAVDDIQPSTTQTGESASNEVDLSITGANTGTGIQMTYGQTDAKITTASTTEGATITYTSGNDAVVTVSKEGALTAKKAGTAEITVTASKEGMTSTSKTVSVTVGAKTISVSSATVADKTYDKTTGATVQNVTFSDTGLTDADYEKNAVFASADAAETVSATVTVKLTAAGKEKYIFADNKDTATVQTTGKISQADVNVTIPDLTVKTGTTLEQVGNLVVEQATIKGVDDELVAGTFSEPVFNSHTQFQTNAVTSWGTAGKYTLKTTFTPTSANYKEKTDISFNCDLTGQTAQTGHYSAATAEVTFGDQTAGLPTLQDVQGKVSYASTNPKVAIVDATSGTVTIVGVGQTTIVADIEGNNSYAAGTASYTLTVKPKTLTTGLEDISGTYTYTYTGNAHTPEVTVKDGDKALTKDTDYTVAYSNNVDAGTAKVTVTLKGNYTGTLSKEFTIGKAQYAGETAVSVPAFRDKTQTFNLPNAAQSLKGAQDEYASYATETLTGFIKEANVTRQQLTVKTNKTGDSGTVAVKITNAKNYNDFTITYTLTASAKKNISQDIRFADASYPYVKDTKHKLDVPTIRNYAEDNTKWTYTWRQVGAPATHSAGASTMPEFEAVGVYEVTATYEDDTALGTKTATLTIQPAVKSTITVSASQMSSRRDDNYSSFDLRERDKEDGYIRLYADADDELVRQTVDGDRAYWIGMDVYPKIGNQETTSDLYVSSDQKSWKKLTGDHRMGDLYIEDVGAKSFELWFDTDGDTDHHDSLYLATDDKGANAFRIKVDFDSYYGNSDDDDDKDSDCTSSHTSKVDGDKVATTTIDRTPSVKGGSAKVTISQSVITDAIDENKDEYKHEKADRKVIAIDVNTSKSCDETVVTLAKKSVDKIADADAALRLITKQGTVTIDDRALAAMVADASGSDIDFYLEKVKDDKFRIYAKSGRTYLTDLGKGDAQAVLPYTLGRNEKASDLRVYRVGDGQNDLTRPVEMEDVSHKSKKLTFTADALGEFRITTDQLTDTGSAAYFYDVPSDRWSAPYIYQLAALGVINGTGANRFEPQLYVTREEFVKMLAGVAGADVSVYRSNSFTDVPSDRWSAPYIAWAANLGVTHGDTPTAFAPAKYITRQEMAAMIYRYVQISGKTLPARNSARTFADDALIADWAEAPVRAMQQAGIIDGNVNYGRYTFDPLLSASREECAKMLAILHDLI